MNRHNQTNTLRQIAEYWSRDWGGGGVGGGWQRWVTVINGSWFRWTRDHRLASLNMALGRATSNLVCNKPGCPAPHNHHRHTLHRFSWLGLKAGLVGALIYLPILSSLTVDPTNESSTGIRGFTKPREWNCWGSQGNPGSQPTHSSTPNSGLLGWERNLVWMYHQYSPPHNYYTIGHYHCHWPIETRSALVTVLKPGLVFNAYLLKCALILDFSLFQPHQFEGHRCNGQIMINDNSRLISVMFKIDTLLGFLRLSSLK